MTHAGSIMAIPRPSEVDADWLSGMLRQYGFDVRILTVSIEPVGTGQLGDTVRMTVGYSRDVGAPTSIIGKFAAADQGSRDIAAAWQLYEREVGFYRNLAKGAGIRTPLCYATALGEDGSFALLLEDCSGAKTGDQFAGLSPEEAEGAMIQAARLHARFWNRGDASELAWLDSGRMAQPFYDASVLRGAWPAFRDRYADRLTVEMLQVCDRLTERYDRYIQPLDRPRCVTHNDYRPDNMLFAKDGTQITVDWQSAALGFNAVDIAYLIGGSYSPGQRRECEQSLLRAYLGELVSQGVEGYSMAELEADYRHFSFAGINVAVGAAMMVKRTERGDRMFLTMLDRHVSHVLDTGALTLLD